jgi:tetratricopeptide (TPR) repeat protein
MELDEANKRIQSLQSTLETTRKEAEALKADYDTEVARLQRDKSNLQSALGSLKREVAEGKQKFSPGIDDFKKWMRDSSVDADTLISDLDPSNSSSDTHHVLAHNALLNVHSEIWSSAYEDANKSIVTRPSAMGYITKALAQIGKGEPEKAMRVFDLAFGNCNPIESNLLLLIKAVILFMAEKYEKAISRVHDLIAVSSDDEAMYCYIQVYHAR